MVNGGWWMVNIWLRQKSLIQVIQLPHYPPFTNSIKLLTQRHRIMHSDFFLLDGDDLIIFIP